MATAPAASPGAPQRAVRSGSLRATSSTSTRWMCAIARRRYATTLEQHTAYSALDTLALDTHTLPNADQWCRVFLKHAELFALGAAAPRTDFRDWRHQVLLPRDGYWGGAPAKAQLWYRNLTGALAREEWSNVAYSAGVLSAYLGAVNDPFNTVWSEAGDSLHAAWRRSVLADHAALLHDGRPLASSAVVLIETPEFLARAMGNAADRAANSYERVLAHFNLARAVVAPVQGFDMVGRQVAAERLATATNLIAAILARAIADNGAAAPAVLRLWPNTVVQVLMAPAAAVKRFKLNRAAGIEVAHIHDEVLASGRLVRFLPESDKTIADLYRSEVEATRLRTPINNVFPFPTRPVTPTRADASTRATPATEDAMNAEVVSLPARRQAAIEGRRGVVAEPPRPAPKRRDAPLPRHRYGPPQHNTSKLMPSAAGNAAAPPDAETTPSDAVARVAATVPLVSTPVSNVITPAAFAEPRSPLSHTPADVSSVDMEPAVPSTQPLTQRKPDTATPPPLAMRDRDSDAAVDPSPGTPTTADDDIIRAPSVGVRTARDFRTVGVDTLDDFARVHPIALVARLEDKTLDPAIVEIWQHEVRLMLAVPTLSGANARLLVGSGFATRDDILAADVDTLCAAVLRFATTTDGRAALTSGPAPDIETIKAVIDAIRAAAA